MSEFPRGVCPSGYTVSVHWRLFGSTFALIFISELPDKTAFATVLLASRARPLAVFCGAAAAFVVQSVVAVTFGRLLSALPERVVHFGAGIVFIVLGVSMWRRRTEEDDDRASIGEGFLKEAASAFTVIFIAEWGDLTQLATATIAAKYAAPLTILIAAILALWSVTGIGVAVGHFAGRAVSSKSLQRFAAVALAAVGLYFFLR